jgi:hypothetical protein
MSRPKRDPPPRDEFEFLSRWWSDVELRDVELLAEQYYAAKRCAPNTIRLTQRALLSAAIVLMVARLEAFLEECFRWAARRVSLSGLNRPGDSAILGVLDRFHNPTVDHTRGLFRAIGINDIWAAVLPKRHGRAEPLKAIDDLVNLRHEVAHGRVLGGNVRFPITLKATTSNLRLLRWFFPAFADALRAAVCAQVSRNVNLTSKGSDPRQ